MNGYELPTEALDLDASEPRNLNPSDFRTGDHVLWTLSLIERIYGA